MDKITHEMRLSQWTDIMKACAASGIKKSQWCKENGVNEKLFYYWQRRVRKENYPLAVAGKENIVIQPEPKTSFMQLIPRPDPEPHSGSPVATIRVHGYSIEISESASDSFLKRLIGALSYAE